MTRTRPEQLAEIYSAELHDWSNGSYLTKEETYQSAYLAGYARAIEDAAGCIQWESNETSLLGRLDRLLTQPAVEKEKE